ncbi:PREDICTED: rab9 effector protein with kelch motifs-like [Nanorana parkeri]|uniref:rab9 effector protein with kelch motifs-like n=1 Tax=Nanorana parkeri TaxID=125878 RepID=UPI000854B506|nr:PREDICTED: rab9 effector protein with kelch motifs-like [Nanorana parkeri]
MALASGHWIEMNVCGDPPRPRYGHTLTVAGNIAFIFGGCSISSNLEENPLYLNDFYMLTITSNDLTWEVIPQAGNIPTPREGHDMFIVKRKIYLFGGCCDKSAEQCLPGMYACDLGTLTWEKLKVNGAAPQTLSHSIATVGENVFVYGGIHHGRAVDDLHMFNTISETWVPVKTSGSLPEARLGHSFATVGQQIYMFGGSSVDGVFYSDVYMLDTATLTWQCCEIKGETPAGRKYHSFTEHHDKDIYLFGGIAECGNETEMLKCDVMKLSLAKMKWKTPLYFGVPPASRYKHTSFVLQSHLYIFGGRNKESDFNDVMAMRLINPSDRQPIMKDILLECGIQGISNGYVLWRQAICTFKYTPTKIPKVKYQLSELQPARFSAAQAIPEFKESNFTFVRGQAIEKIKLAFTLLDSEFEKFDHERANFAQEKATFYQEKEEFKRQNKIQQQELQEMLEKHKTQNEAWLKARAEENDKERREISKLRDEILLQQKKLKEEQQMIEKRNQQLISIMQQFKGM